ncbi:SDR family NAD(P)-dependent oxidoreductase [Actinokineospora enzanensis]|uniref:SDR family NAD(P)-dependent oxidoreductase n=1 Tax=Actinokineospora enzanensis TaxID=155975 RepID=UPI000379E2B4|nr:SDR family oxidoreductase [Actinokineospora enzanensis]
MDSGLRGKRVLVTGGTRGIGRAVAVAFAGAGARVVVCHRTGGDAADEMAAELAGIGGGHLVVRADVTDRGDVGRLVERCRAHLGGLDVLVGNVGVDGQSPFRDLADDEWHRVVDHNLTSAYLVTQAALDLLADGASVVFVGSAAALRGRPLGAHYAASKAALIGLTRGLCKELGGRGIRVNTVAPGVTETGGGLPPEVRQRLTAVTPLGRLATPADVAGAVLFLAGDTSTFVTGTTLTVDGGI